MICKNIQKLNISINYTNLHVYNDKKYDYQSQFNSSEVQILTNVIHILYMIQCKRIADLDICFTKFIFNCFVVFLMNMYLKN